MKKQTILSAICGLVLLVFMLLQFKSQSELLSNFDEFQSKRYILVKEQFSANGFSEYQASLIAGAIRDESAMLKSTIFSNALMQSYMTTMSCLVLLSLLFYVAKKEKKNDNLTN